MLVKLNFLFSFVTQNRKKKSFFLLNPVEFPCQPNLPTLFSLSVIPTKLASLRILGHNIIRQDWVHNCQKLFESSNQAEFSKAEFLHRNKTPVKEGNGKMTF